MVWYHSYNKRPYIHLTLKNEYISFHYKHPLYYPIYTLMKRIQMRNLLSPMADNKLKYRHKVVKIGNRYAVKKVYVSPIKLRVGSTPYINKVARANTNKKGASKKEQPVSRFFEDNTSLLVGCIAATYIAATYIAIIIVTG